MLAILAVVVVLLLTLDILMFDSLVVIGLASCLKQFELFMLCLFFCVSVRCCLNVM